MPVYYYNCMVCGNPQSELRSFHDDTAFCLRCGAYGAENMPGKPYKKMLRVTFRCPEKIDWSADVKEPGQYIERDTTLASPEQINQYLIHTEDPLLAQGYGIEKASMPFIEHGVTSWVEESILPEEDRLFEPEEELVYATLDEQAGHGYKASGKLAEIAKNGRTD